MAPMIDMIFLLLIFFLVAGNYRPEEDYLPFQLPTALGQEANRVKPEPLVIRIAGTPSGCEVRINVTHSFDIDQQDSEQGLASMLSGLDECMRSQGRFTSDPVEIVCEPEVKWEYLAKIYNTLYGAGLTDITFRMTE
jgi:biopolymer transport protein ExbD